MMMEHAPGRSRSRWIPLVLILMTIGLAIHNAVTLRTIVLVDAMADCTPHRRSLPCEAIPVRFVLDDPVCADKLLRAMNVTNARILPRGSWAQSPEQKMASSMVGRVEGEAG